MGIVIAFQPFLDRRNRKLRSRATPRRLAERALARAQGRAELISRLRAKVAEHGPKSTWAEMLAVLVQPRSA